MSIKQQPQNPKDKILQYQFRYITLKEQQPKLHQKSLKKLIKLLQQDEWILDMGVYCNCSFKAIADYIVEAKTIKLWLGYNARPYILQDIMRINFLDLKQLSLAHNQIDSIEPLTFLNFPKLQQIEFRQNVLTNLGSFKKINLPELRVISMYRNHTKQTLSLSYMRSPNLKTIWIQYEDDEPVQGESIASLSKLQSSQLKSIAAATLLRMREPTVEKTICRKYPDIKIYRSVK